MTNNRYIKSRFFFRKFILLLFNSSITDKSAFNGVFNKVIASFEFSVIILFSTPNSLPNDFNLSAPLNLALIVIKGLLNKSEKIVP